MRVLVLGGGGMLGHKVFQVLSAQHQVSATFRNARGKWTTYPTFDTAGPEQLFGGVDALDFDSVIRVFAEAKPEFVVNCIGAVKQRDEAKDAVVSIALNALFPHRLSALCEASQARLIHISTDCVFSGRKGNYTEDDIPDAEDLYGRSKQLGEITDQPGTLTLRTSIIGRDFERNSGLLEWFLSQRGSVMGFKNALYTGLTTHALACVIRDLIECTPKLFGLYQVATSPPLSKYELLLRIRAALKVNIDVVPDEVFCCDRSLSARRFVAATGFRLPTWDEMLGDLAADKADYERWRSQPAIT